ncbi:hypothetical protein VE02_04512 [Pseudogymnoascus sp. 03VT05]|nr:hypothetical protein VE02_04512 [Pseudogymnoascus sp. 03VT05]
MPAPVDFSTTGIEHPRTPTHYRKKPPAATRVTRHIGSRQCTSFHPLDPRPPPQALALAVFVFDEVVPQFRRVMASKGSFNSAIPEEASVGQAQHDSPPGQSNGANKDPMEPGVSPPGSLVPALSAHSFEKKEEPRLSRRYTGIMHFLCALCVVTQAQIPRAGMPATWTPRYLSGLLTGEVRGDGVRS